MILDNVPISLLISGLFCVTIICVTALILAWRALSKGSQFVPDKVYLWIPITIGIFALSLDLGYSAERKAFFLTALLIGAYYFSDITHVVGDFLVYLSNVKKKENDLMQLIKNLTTEYFRLKEEKEEKEVIN